MCTIPSRNYKANSGCYTIMNQVLAVNERSCDLGVSYNKCLNFPSHINKICSKASQRTKLILKGFILRDLSC